MPGEEKVGKVLYGTLPHPERLARNPEVLEELKNTAVLIPWSVTRPAIVEGVEEK
jgi:hypothetical protein